MRIGWCVVQCGSSGQRYWPSRRGRHVVQALDADYSFFPLSSFRVSDEPTMTRISPTNPVRPCCCKSVSPYSTNTRPRQENNRAANVVLFMEDAFVSGELANTASIPLTKPCGGVGASSAASRRVPCGSSADDAPVECKLEPALKSLRQTSQRCAMRPP